MRLELLLLLFLVFYLRKFMRDGKLYPEYDKQVSTAMVVLGILFLMQLTIGGLRLPFMWLTFAAFGALAYVIIYRPEFKPIKPVLNIVLPYIAVSFLAEFIRLVSSKLYSDWSGYISTAKTFALLWLFAMIIINNRQRKALEKEKRKNAEIEREIKISDAIKKQLEIQVAERTAAITRQKEELQHTLDELKNTQKQLIQAEKMASLGELTAGIAHEIQNPLNFVNNFSDVSRELMAEMLEEIKKGNTEEVALIAGDINQNLEKINHHGRRADAIVKGMLQHSRTSKGIKEETDINELADEYLRLSYHGLRAKDKSFNATMHTEFDKSIGKINIIPQDVGRVLLNLVNNAFYAVAEKAKTAGPEYKPTVTVTTKRLTPPLGDGGVAITVADNGSGIPQSIVDKIFQPFFTTKPTGQGTGLGLSLSFDIIKAHSGDIKVNTEEGRGTSFIIILPLK